GNTASDTAADCADQLTHHKETKSFSVRSDRQNQHQNVCDDHNERTNRNGFFLTEFCNDLSYKRSKQEQTQIRYHTCNTGNLRILKVRLESNLHCHLCAVHTDKLSNRRQSRSYCRTVSQEVSDCFDNVKFLSLLTYGNLSFHTNLRIADHELESDESKNAHDKSDEENSLSGQVVACIINQERQDNRTGDTSQHRTDGTCCGKFCSLYRFRSDQRQQGTVRNIRYGIECIPADISYNEQDVLNHTRSALPGNKTKCTCYHQTDRTKPNVRKKFVSLILAFVRVYHCTDHRVVDCVPYLHQQKKKRHCVVADPHKLGPEQ